MEFYQQFFITFLSVAERSAKIIVLAYDMELFSVFLVALSGITEIVYVHRLNFISGFDELKIRQLRIFCCRMAQEKNESANDI